MAYYQRYMQLGLIVIFANARMIICIIKKNPFHHATFFCGIYIVIIQHFMMLWF